MLSEGEGAKWWVQQNGYGPRLVARIIRNGARSAVTHVGQDDMDRSGPVYAVGIWRRMRWDRNRAARNARPSRRTQKPYR